MAVIGAIKGAMSALAHGIPEIGQTISIAGQIITRNLLWPLRKELIPLLQKVLNWVRDNRKMFIQLGSVIANAFKMIKGIFQAVATAVSPITNVIKSLFQSIFGSTAQSFADTMNLIMFKITAFAMVVSAIVKPLFEGIALVIDAVIKVVKKMGASFMEAFSFAFAGGNMDAIQSMKEALSSLADVIKTLEPLLNGLAYVSGFVLGSAVKGTLMIMKELYGVINDLFTLISNPSKYFDKFKSELKELGTGVGGFFKDAFQSDVDIVKNAFGKKPEQKQDVIITKSGRVLETSPQDTIIATKNPGAVGGGKQISVSVSFGDFHVTTTEGNAVRAGQGVVRGVEQQIKNILLDTLVAEGAR